MSGSFSFLAPTVTSLNNHGKGTPPSNSVSFGPGRVESPLDITEIERAAGIVRQTGVNYAVSSAMLAVTRLMSHGTLTTGAAGGYSVSSFASLPPADPTNFRLFYETSNYVIMDFNAAKSNVSRILSSNIMGIMAYRNAMEQNNPALLAECNNLLSKSASEFLLSAGDYGIDMFYRAPTAAGNTNSKGVATTRTFRYGFIPIVPSGLIRRRGW
jgi:hypothetical protein